MKKRTEHILLLMAYYACVGILLFTVLIALTGCAHTITSHSLDGWTVVYNDTETIERLCGPWAIGCCDYSTQTIYCALDAFEVCGHELKHITHGRFHR
jgi:hypothetical protein